MSKGDWIEKLIREKSGCHTVGHCGNTCSCDVGNNIKSFQKSLLRRVRKLRPAPASEYAGRILLEEEDVIKLIKGDL